MPEAPTPPPARDFMTRIPGRHPEVKSHLNIGQAKNACSVSTYRSGGSGWLHEVIDGIFTGRRKYSSSHRGGEIWQMKDGDWVLLHDLPEGVRTHQLPWKAEEYEFFVDDKDGEW